MEVWLGVLIIVAVMLVAPFGLVLFLYFIDRCKPVSTYFDLVLRFQKWLEGSGKKKGEL